MAVLERAAPVAPAIPRIEVCGLPVDNATMDEALDAVAARIAARAPTRLYYLNADCVNIAHRDEEYAEVIRCGDLVFADGSGLRLAGKMLRTPIRDNVNGTDMFPLLCERAAREGWRIFLLGARPGIADAVAEWIGKHHPDATVCGTHHGYFESDETDGVVAAIAKTRPDVLFVAFGAPRQEAFVDRYLEQSGACVGLGVGGLFDFFSGRMPRAPRWMRKLGIEWLYRFWREPGRMWRRYWIGNFVFVWRVWRSKR